MQPDFPALPQRRHFLAAAGAVPLLTTLPAIAARPAAPASPPFEPKLGQHGKDVMWLPTPQPLIDRLLTMAGVGPDDTLVDLGSGDGKIVITAARDFGAQARGIEFDERMVELSRYNAGQAGVAERASFERGDIFASDFSNASVVAMYLLPQLNLQLRPTLMAMRPGTRIVTHQFHLGNWEPEETTLVSHRPGYLWIVPAHAAGRWQLELPGSAPVALELAQAFQKLEGTVSLPGIENTLRTPRLAGERIAFAYTDAQGRLLEFEGRVSGKRMQGTVKGAGEPAPFSARLQEAAPVAGTEPASEEELMEAAAALGGE